MVGKCRSQEPIAERVGAKSDEVNGRNSKVSHFHAKCGRTRLACHLSRTVRDKWHRYPANDWVFQERQINQDNAAIEDVFWFKIAFIALE